MARVRPEQAKADEVELAVQVNGKVKAKIMVAADAAEDDIKAVGLAAVEAALEGKDVKKVVVVPGPPGERSSRSRAHDKAGTLRNGSGFRAVPFWRGLSRVARNYAT